MDNGLNEIQQEELRSGITREELILNSTHSFIAEYYFRTKQVCFFPEKSEYETFYWEDFSVISIEDIIKVIYKPDIPLFKEFINFSSVNVNTKRSINVRLYTVPHIFEWFHVTIACYVDSKGEAEKAVVVFTNAEKELEAAHQLKDMVKLDFLTQLPNIDTFSLQTKNLLESNTDKEYVMIRMDMHKFRLLNQLYGTKEGDNVLRFLGVKIQEYMESEEQATYCHIASDVFAICMNYNKQRLDNLVVFIQDSMDKYPLNFEMIMTFGVYKIEQEDRKADVPIMTLVDRAASAQRVKCNYVNHVAFFDASIAEMETAEQNVILEMNKALENEQYQIYLQPKVNMYTKEIVGSEALVRWLHPTKGLVSPADFVPVFEKNGFITEIDYYILEKTCKAIRRWLDSGVKALPVSVNLSRANLYSPKILEEILRCVEYYKIPHDLIEFEITESAFVSDNVHLNNLIVGLQENNFKVLMDDFGSGYSSLNSLRELSVDVLKIDIKFLPVTSNDKRANVILTSIVDMGNQLGLELIIEGVETEEQAEFLRTIGCSVAQGYLYYKPMTLDEYEKCL